MRSACQRLDTLVLNYFGNVAKTNWYSIRPTDDWLQLNVRLYSNKVVRTQFHLGILSSQRIWPWSGFVHRGKILLSKSNLVGLAVRR